MHRDDFVADGDDAVRDDVGVQSPAVHQALDHAGLGQPFERLTGMAQLDTEALDAAWTLATSRAISPASAACAATLLARFPVEAQPTVS